MPLLKSAFLFAFQRAASRPTDLTAIFVVGPPRCGTTLLQSRLEAHSQIFGLQRETGFFRPDIYKRAHYWPARYKKIFTNTMRRGLTQHFTEFATTDTPPNTVFVEKTPQHVKNIKFIARNFPKSKIVCLNRDPRDAFTSAQSNPNVRQSASPKEFAKYFNSCAKARLRARKHDTQIYDISYETLTSEPEEQIRLLMKFLRLPYQDQQMQAISDPRARSAAFKKLSSPISPSSVGRWRENLPHHEADVIWKMSGPYFQQLAQISAPPQKPLRKQGV